MDPTSRERGIELTTTNFGDTAIVNFDTPIAPLSTELSPIAQKYDTLLYRAADNFLSAKGTTIH